jgi:RNA polymerase sigma-70 factor, ECF subfamily
MNVSKLPSHDLLRLCLQSHDESLWLEFVRRFQPLIARVVVKSIRRWTIPTPGWVDDLVQDTYLKLCANNFRALRQFDCLHENALFGFVKVVASNVVQDHFRNLHSQKRGSGRDDEELDDVSSITASDAGAAERFERLIQIAEVARCLDTQAGQPNFIRDRTVFWLYYQQGLTAKAISEIPGIGLSIKGVESTLLRLIRMVREKMNASPAKPSPSTASGPAGRASAAGR